MCIRDSLYSNAYDANAVMLFRTAGVSLIYLKSYEHENEFYHILIYDKNVRELNRNFHIIYYSTKGYKAVSYTHLDVYKRQT